MKHDLAQLEPAYNTITSLYDVADSLIAGVNKLPESKQGTHFNLVNPLVEQLETAADILTEEFLHMAENESDQPCKRSKKAVETTLRLTYAAFDAFARQMQEAQGDVLARLKSIAPLVQKARQMLEEIIAAFVQFSDLALDRIMQKSDLDALKAKQPLVATMLHNMAQGRG